MPSQHPDRVECVFMVATDGKTAVSRGLQIIRDKPGGRIISLVEHKLPEGVSLESWMLKGMIP